MLQYRCVACRVANARAAVTDMEKVACSIASPQGLIIWICNTIHNGGCYPATCPCQLMHASEPTLETRTPATMMFFEEIRRMFLAFVST